MVHNVYKTENGREIMESMYRGILGMLPEGGYEQFFVPSTHGTTHVLRFGDPSLPPVIMIHGSMSNSASWLGAVPLFIDSFCVYCIDVPGDPGLSDPVRLDLHSEEPAEWLSSVMDGLKIDRAACVGMSLGSWYALQLAVNHPNRVTSLSMITVSGIIPEKRSFIIKSMFFMLLGKWGQKKLNRTLYHKTEVPREVLDYQAAASKHIRPMTGKIPIFTDEELKKITARIQYVGGDHDALLDTKRTAARLRRLFPAGDIRILEDTGHVILDKFTEIKHFLETTTAAV